MDKSQIGKEKYKQMVERVSPNSKMGSNCVKAFLVGGLICVIGQIVTACFTNAGASKDDAGMYTSILLVLAAVLLTGFGIYEKIGKFAGAGSIVPITGFANSVAAPALEFKKEGYVLGVGAKIFIVAGPVILYGVTTSVVVGIIYYFMK